MRITILIFIVCTSSVLFAQKTDSLKLEQLYRKIDSMQYSELDYLKMQQYFNNNLELKTHFSKTAQQGDKNAKNFLEMLTISYEKANEKFGGREIEVLIHSYYMSTGIKEKFNKLNSEFNRKLDSLKLQREYFEKEILKEKQIIDSLKNK